MSVRLDKAAAPLSDRLAAARRRFRSPGVGSDIAALAILALATLVLHHAALLWGAYFYQDDTRLFYYPLTRWFAAELTEGRLPLWNPEMFGGYPLLADGEAGMLYPPQIVALLVFSPEAAMIALRILHTALAAVSSYALARTFGVAPASAIVAGSVFAFGSFHAAQVHHENVVRTAAWLPLILALAELAWRAEGSRRARWLALAALALGMSALAVHVQPVLLSLLALATFIGFRSLIAPSTGLFGLLRALPGRVWRAGWMLSALVGLGLALAAAQWVPLFELTRLSFRSGGVEYDFATAFALPPEHFVMLAFPYFFRDLDGAWWTLWSWWETHLYVGIPTLALALAGVLLARQRAVLYFGALAAGALLVALADRSPFNLHEIVWQIPGLSSLRAPGRYSELVVLGAGLLAAFGADAVARNATSRVGRGIGVGALMLGAAFAALLVAVHLLLIAFPDSGVTLAQLHYLSRRHENPTLSAEQVVAGVRWSTSLANPKTALSLALLVGVAALFLARPRIRSAQLWGLLAAGLVTLDLLAFASDLHPSERLEAFRPSEPVVTALISPDAGPRLLTDPRVDVTRPNALAMLGVSDANGYSSLQSQRHFDYWSHVTTRFDALLDLWGVRTLIVADSGAGQDSGPLATALAEALERDDEHFQVTGTVPGGILVRNTRAMPPAFVVGNARLRASRQEATALVRMQAPDFDPRREVVLEEGPEPGPTPMLTASYAAAQLSRPNTDRIEVRVSADAPGYLVVTESYHRGWTATVDGVSAPVYLGDLLFLAVQVPPGEHLVVLEFAPLSLSLGLSVSAASAVILVALLLYRRRWSPSTLNGSPN